MLLRKVKLQRKVKRIQQLANSFPFKTFFSLYFTKCKVKNYRPKKLREKPEKQAQMKKKNHLCVAFIIFV